VLGEFTNSAGDLAFEGTLREALGMQFDASPFLKVMGDEQMRQDLKFMGRPMDERITNRIAHEICEREGDKAMLSGTIAELGKAFAITVSATNCRTGEPLVREQVQAGDKEHVLSAIASAATGIRGKLGESLASIQKEQRLRGQVTTSSLEALRSYYLGMSQYFAGEYRKAVPLFRRATEIDPKFATAWRMLGVSCANAFLGGNCMADAYTQAFLLRDRVSERERFAISGAYFRNVTRETAKAREAYEGWAQAYPRDGNPHQTLGSMHAGLGELGSALEEFREARQLEPWDAGIATNLIYTFMRMDRFAEAKEIANQVFERKADPPRLHEALLRVAYIQGDDASVRKEIEWFQNRPEEAISVEAQGNNAISHGRFRDAMEIYRRGAELARQQNQAALAKNFEAEIDETSRLRLAGCDIMRRTYLYPLCSVDFDGYLKDQEQFAKEHPADTEVAAIRLPVLRAIVALKYNKPDKVLETLRPLESYDLYDGLNVPLLRGAAYLLLRQPTGAISEFQKVIDHPGNYWGFGVFGYLGVAKAATLGGDTARARKAYQDFLALWKNADPDVPLLKYVREDYGALH
jgi:eukaryotic-like serine/threonine-protein kinase